MTTVFFPVKGCDFTASIALWDRDMSAYYIQLKHKLNNSDVYIVNQFVQDINEKINTNFTGDTPVIDVMRVALESSNTIAYITEGDHSRSLQMKNRSGLKDYIPPYLGKEKPMVINDNTLDITKEKVNENSAKDERIIKYLKVMRDLKLSYNENDYINDKDYREATMMNVDNENYMKRYQHLKDVDKKTKEKIKKQVKIEEEQEKKDKVNDNVISNSIIAMSKEVPSVIDDNELGVTKEKVNVNKPKKRITISPMTVDKFLEYMRVMEYYKVIYDEDRFIHDKEYRKGKMKFVDDNNYLQKYNSQKHNKRGQLKEFQDEDEIQAVLDAENVEE
jgi:hypothetical protein